METIFYLQGNALMVQLSGEIDHHVADRLRCDIDSELEFYGAKDLIFDFSHVEFMDSSGIGMVFGRYKKVKARGGTVMIRNAGRLVRQILDMAGVFSLIAYEETVDEQGGRYGE